MTSVKHAFEARQKRRLAANPAARYHHNNNKRNKLRKLSPEERYQMMKEAWYFHESSWYMRHDNGYDGYGCSEFGCVPECKYYHDYNYNNNTTTIPQRRRQSWT